MKKSLVLLGLILPPFFTLPAHAQGYFGASSVSPTPVTPTATATPLATGAPALPAPSPVLVPRSRILTEDDFRAFLTGTTWQWRGPGLHNTDTLTFYADGTARNSDGWVAKFVIKSIAEIELRMIGGYTAKMTFDPTYTRFDGIDFDKKRPLQGQREK